MKVNRPSVAGNVKALFSIRLNRASNLSGFMVRFHLTDTEKELLGYISEIEDLLEQDKIPPVLNSGSCKKCAYYEYCYI